MGSQIVGTGSWPFFHNPGKPGLHVPFGQFTKLEMFDHLWEASLLPPALSSKCPPRGRGDHPFKDYELAIKGMARRYSILFVLIDLCTLIYSMIFNGYGYDRR